MLKFVLFDLDGTLLPMDQDKFVNDYFGRLCKKMIPHGYEKESLINSIWTATVAVIKNDGSYTNEKVFWDVFTKILGEKCLKDAPIFDEFYAVDFSNVQSSCGYNPEAEETVNKIKNMGLRAVLATNPIFPAVATESRIRWAGLRPQDFELYTTYENCCYAKPNIKYYEYVLEKLGAKPEECLMVGNDVGEDMVAESLGLKVFLLTDCLINKTEKDISEYPNGSFSELLEYVRSLLNN